MRIRLLKKWENHGKVYPRGQIITITPALAERKIKAKEAEQYNGPYPPPKGREGKMKTNLFKPK